LPFPDASVDRIICNPPFGQKVAVPAEIGPLYRRAIAEWDRVLKPGGRAVLLVADPQPLLDAIQPVAWSAQKQYRVRVLGLPAHISVWRKRENPI
jgi:tRNA (guanine6-N2)-methyltransferase